MKYGFGARALLLVLLLTFSPTVGNSQDALDVGPAVGTKLPHDLSTQDQYGKQVDFQSLVHRRGLIILFTRSLDW